MANVNLRDSASPLHMAALRIGSFVGARSICDDLGQTSFHSPLPHRYSGMEAVLLSLPAWNQRPVEAPLCDVYRTLTLSEEGLTVAQSFMQLFKPRLHKKERRRKTTKAASFISVTNYMNYFYRTKQKLLGASMKSSEDYIIFIFFSYKVTKKIHSRLVLAF